ncbi:MAG: sulfatase-like hydrolase/transferase [Myxococcaceae bacterium]|nr:sulfatase-like hydrolase/transferase [Myxococcaceae bacterium]
MFSRLKLVTGFFSFFYLTSVLHRVAFALDNWPRASTLGRELWPLIVHYSVAADVIFASALTVIPALLIGAQFFLAKTERWLKFYAAIAIVLISIVNTVDLLIYRFWGIRCNFDIIKTARDPAAIWANLSGALFVDIVLRFLPCLAMLGALAWWTLFREINCKTAFRRSDLVVYIPISAILCLSAFVGATPYKNDQMNDDFFGANQEADVTFALESLKNPLYVTLYQILPTIRELPECVYPKDLEVRDFEYADDDKSEEKLLTADRPNIILVIGESFSSNVISFFHGNQALKTTPQFDRLAREGILFKNFYANESGTIGALKVILQGNPIGVDAISMPSLSKVLKDYSYLTRFYYGGDLSLFGLKVWLKNNEFEKIMGNRDFSPELPRIAWGVHDHAFFDAVADDLEKYEGARPFFSVLLTLSNHEPFDVPEDFQAPTFACEECDSRMLRAIAYADDSFGKFIDRLKKTPLWEKTLVIFVADHGHHGSPFDVSDARRYEIPMLWLGGVVRQSQIMNLQGSQADLAATLLGQLGIDASEFYFSRNMFMDKDGFCFYQHQGGDRFGIVKEDQVHEFDCATGQDRTIQGDGSIRALGWSYVRALLEYRDKMLDRER